MKTLLKTLFFFAFALLLSGCAPKKNSLYSWDRAYIDSVYTTLNNENDAAGDIGKIEKYVQQSIVDGKKVPPGVYAHLGLLYSKVGNDGQALVYFEKEANAFPESRHYMNFIAKKGSKNEK